MGSSRRKHLVHECREPLRRRWPLRLGHGVEEEHLPLQRPSAWKRWRRLLI